MTERFDLADMIRSIDRCIYPNPGDRQRAADRLDAMIDGRDESGRIHTPPIDRSVVWWWRNRVRT